jgi:hypothetical protein
MGTSPVVMAGRQFGKSVFGKNVTAVWADEANFKAQPSVRYLEYNDDPLALVCAVLRVGRQPYEAVEVLNNHQTRTTSYISIKELISHQDRDRANEIYDYFNKKHTVRRIKGEWISEYMLFIEELCNERQKINSEHVKILVSLPRIYEQNKNIESVIKGRNSVKELKGVPYTALRSDLEFVNKFRIKRSNVDEVHYFWSTPKNYLVRFIIPYNSCGMNAWDVLAKHGKIHASSEVVNTQDIKGYKFNVLQPAPAYTEITTL